MIIFHNTHTHTHTHTHARTHAHTNTHTHGFRSKRSTTTSLLEFYEMVTETMDRGCAIDIFYFDLEKHLIPSHMNNLWLKEKQHAVVEE